MSGRQNDKWYELTPEQVANRFGSDPVQGLDSAEAEKRSRILAERLREEQKGKKKEDKLRTVADLTAVLLIFTALLAHVFDRGISSATVIVLVAVNAAAALVAYIRAQGILLETGERAEPRVYTVRSGKAKRLPGSEIVPGDVIYVSAGDVIPADARIVQSDGITVSETDITGEHGAVRKRSGFPELRGGSISLRAQTNMLFSGSVVMSGSARAVVCRTGSDTEHAMLRAEQEEQRRITAGKGKRSEEPVLAAFRSMRECGDIWGLCMIAAVFVVVVLDLIFGKGEGSLFDTFITALSLAVSSMSSYYLAFSHIVVASGVRRLGGGSRERETGALVRRVDKLDSIIDLDTLIIPRSALIASDAVHISRVVTAASIDRRIGEHGFKRHCAEIIKLAVVSSGRYGARKLVYNNLSGNNVYSGEEEMLISCATDLGVYNARLDRDYPMADHREEGEDSRFDTTLYFAGGDFCAVSRGDPGVMLPRCISLRESGGEHRMTDDTRARLTRYVSDAVKDGCRVISVATRRTQYTNLRRIAACQSDLVFEGFIVIREPIIDGAAKSIADCRRAGIKIIMTDDGRGDYGLVLARSLDIVRDPGEATSGAVLAKLSPEMFRVNLPLYSYFARLSPAQTERLVACLRADGHRVGFVADKLDSLPAMLEGDVGYALETSETGEERNAPVVSGDIRAADSGAALRYLSDIVLLRPRIRSYGGFCALVGSVRGAVQTYRNLLRVAFYLIAAQAARITLVLWGIIGGRPLMTAPQVLFSGLVIDFAAVFSIALQPPSVHVLNHRDEVRGRLAKPLRYVARYAVFGVLWALIAALVPTIMRARGVAVSDEQLLSAGFIGFMITQFVALSEIKRERTLLDFRIRLGGAGIMLALLCTALVLISITIAPIGELFDIIPVSGMGFVPMLFTPAVMALVFEADKLVRGDTAVGVWIRSTLGRLFTGKKKKQAADDKTASAAHTAPPAATLPAASAERNAPGVRELFENFDLETFIEDSARTANERSLYEISTAVRRDEAQRAADEASAEDADYFDSVGGGGMEYPDDSGSRDLKAPTSDASVDTKAPIAGSTDAGAADAGYTADGVLRADRIAASKEGYPNVFRNAGNAAGGTAAGKSPMRTGSVGAYTDSGLPRSEAGVSASDSAGSEHAADTSDGQSEFAMGDIIDSIFSDDD